MRKISAILLVFTILALPAVFAGCGARVPDADYSDDVVYQTTVSDTENALTYSPQGVKPRYGMIFYIGTAIGPSNYDYLGKALAERGYLVVFPKFDLGLAFYMYNDDEAAFDAYRDVRFFIGGHSQGGGAALRRAQENPDRTQGLVLLAPLCYTIDGIPLTGGLDIDPSEFYNVRSSTIPTLVLQAGEDRVLSEEQRSAVFDCVNPDHCQTHVISPGSHMSFSALDNDDMLKMFNGDGDGISAEQKISQREQTTQYILDFLHRVVNG